MTSKRNLKAAQSEILQRSKIESQSDLKIKSYHITRPQKLSFELLHLSPDNSSLKIYKNYIHSISQHSSFESVF